MGMADNFNNIRVIPVFDLKVIAASGTGTSGVIDVDDLRVEGFFSLQITLTGDGSCKIQYMLSDSATGTFIVPSNAVNIETGFNKNSATNGTDIISFNAETAPKMKILITETSAANSITVKVRLMVQ